MNLKKNTHRSDLTITRKTTKISIFMRLLTVILFIAILALFPLTFNLFQENNLDPGYITIDICILLFLLAISQSTNYIESTSDFFIVKNLILPFKKQLIPINYIEQIIREEKGSGRSHRIFLRVQMKYHKEYIINIGFINSKRSKNIKKQIRKNNIIFFN